MNASRPSVERIEYTEYDESLRDCLREYYHGVVDGYEAFFTRNDVEHDFSAEDFVRDELAKDVQYLTTRTPAPPLVVAVDDGDVAGCVYLYDLSGGDAEVKRLYVRADYRGLGLGRALMERLIATATEEGYTRLRLDTAPFMTSAQSLYRDLGFSTYEDGDSITDVPSPIREELIYMRLTLDERAH